MDQWELLDQPVTLVDNTCDHLDEVEESTPLDFGCPTPPLWCPTPPSVESPLPVTREPSPTEDHASFYFRNTCDGFSPVGQSPAPRDPSIHVLRIDLSVPGDLDLVMKLLCLSPTGVPSESPVVVTRE